MTIRGVGEKLQFITIGYAVIVIAFHFLFFPFFSIKQFSYLPFLISGVLLIVVGLPLMFVSAVQMIKAFNSSKLVTKGMYAIFLNPMYAMFIIFIVPGIALLFKSWIVLSVPVFMYIVFKILIKDEVRYLEEKFGEEYLKYKKRVIFKFL